MTKQIELFNNSTTVQEAFCFVSGFSIDWYSFTIVIPDHCKTYKDIFAHVEKFICLAMTEDSYKKYFSDAIWEDMPARSRYKFAMWSKDSGIAIFWGGQGHVLFELQGRACSQMAQDDTLKNLIDHFQDRSSRIDIAVDFNGISVQEMANSCTNKRFKSESFKKTQTGQTFYIGNRESERYAKVYEYFEPHERANKPRVEFTYRKNYAKSLAARVSHYSVPEIAQMCNNTFKLEKLPEMSNLKETIPYPKKDKSSSKKISWLLRQVAPAVKDLIRRGEIDEQWLLENFIPDYKQLKLEEIE